MVDPDDWWHSLPIERRRQIYRWVEQPTGTHPETPGQAELFPGLGDPTAAETDRRRRGRSRAS